MWRLGGRGFNPMGRQQKSVDLFQYEPEQSPRQLRLHGQTCHQTHPQTDFPQTFNHGWIFSFFNTRILWVEKLLLRQ